jgi:hypothetical protein
MGWAPRPRSAHGPPSCSRDVPAETAAASAPAVPPRQRMRDQRPEDAAYWSEPLSSSRRQPSAVPFCVIHLTHPNHPARMPVVAISREESVSVAMAACDLKVMSRTIALGVNFNGNGASTGHPFAGSLRTLVGPLFGRSGGVATPPTRATDVTDTHGHWRPAGIPPKAKPRPACSTPKPLAHVSTTREPDRRGHLIMLLSETTCPV